MERLNQTSSVSEFILLGLSSRPEDQKPLFILFLIIYLVTITGNLLIILAIRSDPQLHTPMYFFLSFLSFIDICFSTTIVPRMLVNFLSEKKTISFAGCITQCYFYFFLGTVEFLLLTVMSCNCCATICYPLWYSTIMRPPVCIRIVVFSRAGSFVSVLFPTILISQPPFCDSSVINHFFRDSGLCWPPPVWAPLPSS